MRIWLHHGTAEDPGWTAWSLDHLGFATWAPSRGEVLARAGDKLVEFSHWRTGHGFGPVEVQSGLEVVEEILVR